MKPSRAKILSVIPPAELADLLVARASLIPRATGHTKEWLVHEVLACLEALNFSVLSSEQVEQVREIIKETNDSQLNKRLSILRGDVN